MDKIQFIQTENLVKIREIDKKISLLDEKLKEQQVVGDEIQILFSD